MAKGQFETLSRYARIGRFVHGLVTPAITSLAVFPILLAGFLAPSFATVSHRLVVQRAAMGLGTASLDHDVRSAVRLLRQTKNSESLHRLISLEASTTRAALVETHLADAPAKLAQSGASVFRYQEFYRRVGA